MGQPHHQLALVRRVCSGHCFTLYGALHGGLLRFGHWLADMASLARFSGHGLGHGTALHGDFFQHGLGQVLTPSRRMDADIPSVHGLPHVRHCHLVDVGLGPASWRRKKLFSY